jgi:hypothetical protein
MKKVIPILLFSLILSGCTWFGGSSKAALDIKSDPVTAVYLNDNHVGVTPFYRDDLKPGDYTVRLVVESDPSRTWQTQVNLKPQFLTNITRNFGPSEDNSSHYVLSLDQGSQSATAQITIITQPDNVVVKHNGQPVGFSPKEINGVSVGDHQIDLSSPGYKPMLIPINAIAGYHLTITAKLAKDKDMSAPADPNATSSAQLTPSPSPISPTTATSSAKPAKPYVTINDTETGWLRVRSEPTGTADNEIGKVDVGVSYPFKIANQTGWYQIEYAPGKLGWISARYATLVE